ncbi:MAG: Sensor protein ZraS [Planctomycetota bacterium]
MSIVSALNQTVLTLPVVPEPLPWSWFVINHWASEISGELPQSQETSQSDLVSLDPASASLDLWGQDNSDYSRFPSRIAVWQTMDREAVKALDRLWKSGLFLSQAIDRTAHELGVELPLQGMAWSVLLQGHLWALASRNPSSLLRWLEAQTPAIRRQIEVDHLGSRASIWSQIMVQKLGLEEVAKFLWLTRDLTSSLPEDSSDGLCQSPVLQVILRAYELYEQSRFALFRKHRLDVAVKDPKVSLIEARIEKLTTGLSFVAPDDEIVVNRSVRLIELQQSVDQQRVLWNQANELLHDIDRVAQRLTETKPFNSHSDSINLDGNTIVKPVKRGTLQWVRLVGQKWQALQKFWWQNLERMDDLSDSVGHQQVKSESQAQALRFESMAEFAAGAGHELNNPLAVIQGRAQLLMAKTTDKQMLNSLKAIIDQTLRAHRMLRDLIFIARPSDPVIRYFRPAETLRSVVRELKQETELRNIDLEWNVCRTASRLEMESLDPDGFRQIFLSLARNAIEASPEKSKIKLHLNAEGSGLKILVTDYGHGFDSQEAAHLFDPFYCGRKAGRGLGLGLPRLARIVAQMNGKIRYRSKPGSGTTFEVFLPIVAGASQPLSSSA